jgi:non-specific serine/threonine protein kinase/serine/threonine-protein kinase
MSESEAARWSRVSDILAHALDLPESARLPYLARVCGREPALHSEVLALFHELHGAEQFLEQPPVAAVGRPPAAFGPYRVMRELGEGGMGVVYLGERDDGQFIRRVAIKRVGGLAPGSELRRRFREEREILARLDHPNIARLLDAGVDEAGVPYLVMEYIEGQIVTAFCDARRLSIRERLTLFLSVCGAVQHAHQNLVVHRDIKPANILVTENGTPKLLDFGIAKLLALDGAAASATAHRAMTLDYASPEQVRGEVVTTASDVYSLGLLLYELLTGRQAYSLSAKSVVEAIDFLDGPAVPSPSGVAPDDRRPELAGDLDAIVLNAMARAKEDRYTTVAALAADVAAYLEQRPIAARAPSLAYVARKFARRNRAAVIAAAATALLMASAVGGVVWQARIAERERVRAEQRFAQVRQLANYVIYDLQDGVAKLAGATELRKAMVEKSLRYLDSMAVEAGGDTALLLEIAGAYHRLGDVLGNPGVANLGDRDGPISSYDKARAVYRSILTADPSHAGARQAFAALLLTESNFFGLVGQKDRAERSLTESRAIWESLRRATPDNEPVLQGLAAAEVSSYIRAGGPQSDAALPHMQRALDIFQKLYNARPTDTDRMRDVALCHRYLVTFNLRVRNDSAALDHARRAMELDRRRLAAEPHNAAAKIDYSTDLGQMAVSTKRLGRSDDALLLYLQSLAIRRELWEADRANVFARDRFMYSLKEVGSLQADLARWDDARAHLLQAIEHASALHGRVSDTVPQETLIQSYFHLGRIAKAVKADGCVWFRKSVALAPGTASGVEHFQYRAAVAAALESARDELHSCPP